MNKQDMAIEALNEDAISKRGMTKEEAQQAWKKMRSEIYETNWLFVGTINPQMVDMAIEALSAEPVRGEWTPVSEGLPKEKQEVYVTIYFTEGDTGRAYGYIDGFGKWHLYSTVEGTLNSGYEVTAWMPLPEPYKGGDTE